MYKNNYNQRGSYSQSRYNTKPQAKKHSGAKKTTYTPVSGENKGVEQHLTTGWRLNRNKELISVKAVTTSKSNLSEKGWFGSVAVTFTNTTTGASHFHWGTMHKTTGKVVVDKLAVVINPKAPNGGYCGTYIRK
jgi:hypothetical protein